MTWDLIHHARLNSFLEEEILYYYPPRSYSDTAEALLSRASKETSLDHECVQ